MYRKISLVSIAGIALLYAAASLSAPAIKVIALFKDKAMISINGKQHLLNKGQTTDTGIKLVASNSREAILSISGREQRYTVSGHIGGSYAPPVASPVLHLTADRNGMFRASASINGYALNVLVDTGATFVSMNKNVAKRLGINFKLDGIEGRASTANGITPVWHVKLDRVRLGDIELRDVDASIHDGAFPDITLLGMSFLSRLEMRRDGRIMELRKKY